MVFIVSLTNKINEGVEHSTLKRIFCFTFFIRLLKWLIALYIENIFIFSKLHHFILNKSFQFLTKNPLNFTSFIRIYATFSQRNFQFGTSELKNLLNFTSFLLLYNITFAFLRNLKENSIQIR